MTVSPLTVAAVQAAIGRALEHAPDARPRIERAAALILLGHVSQTAEDAYDVRSQAGHEMWQVTPTSCTCPDAERHPEIFCKHAWAVRVLLSARMEQDRQAEEGRRARFTADRVAIAASRAYRVA